MTPPRSFIGEIGSLRLLRSFRGRAILFGTLIAVALILSVFPQRYRAAATLAPTDPQSLGLSGTLSQLGALNSVFGNQAGVEMALRVGNSVQVRDIVIREARLASRLGGRDRIHMQRWLEDKVSVRALRGGIMLIETKLLDRDLARDIVAAYARATQERLAQINRQQTAYKRDVLVKLTSDASLQLAQAQSAYDAFRLRNRTPSPDAAVDTVTQRIGQLEGAIKAKQIALASAYQLYTDENNVVRQLKAEIAALQAQLATVRATNPVHDSTVGQVVAQSSQQFKLERDLRIQRALYDSYLRFLQGTTVEDLTSTANVRILEPPFVDTERQFWLPAVAAAIALSLLWAAIEFYRLRPPLGARIKAREAGAA